MLLVAVLFSACAPKTVARCAMPHHVADWCLPECLNYAIAICEKDGTRCRGPIPDGKGGCK